MSITSKAAVATLAEDAILAGKKNRIRMLSEEIGSLMTSKTWPRLTKQAVENEEFRLEFQMQSLVNSTQHRECDLKLEAMEKVLELLKNDV